MKRGKVFHWIFLSILILQLNLYHSVDACKDIMACGDATEGEYNLLLKVRDPSRPGYQVLCMVPEGYEYVYHHPWSGKNISFKVFHKYIGVTSIDDVPPSIVKAGMALSDRGLAFGDADTQSRWINPSTFAWDDFDWMRYACQLANSTEEAVNLLTNDVVDTMHAPGISENLLVVGPDNGFLIEADAFRYHIVKITNGFEVISNYPRALWKTQGLKTLPVAASFDTENEKRVTKGDIIKLNSMFGIKIIDIGDEWVTVKQIPFFTFLTYENGKPMLLTDPIKIMVGNRETVVDYSVSILDIQDSRALVHIETVANAWQKQMKSIINQRYGSITVRDMMNWSRLNESMLIGLRPMCEPNFEYEGSAIYKIPSRCSSVLSNGWFAANHACASIFVPFHICNTDICMPYTTGEVACTCSLLSQRYGDRLLPEIQDIETVFLYETERLENWTLETLLDQKNVSAALTISDTSIQNQAWLMLQAYKEIGNFSNASVQKRILSLLNGNFDRNYSNSLQHIKETLLNLQRNQSGNFTRECLESIFKNICYTPIKLCEATHKEYKDAEELFKEGEALLSTEDYNESYEKLLSSFYLAYHRFYDKEVHTNGQFQRENNILIHSIVSNLLPFLLFGCIIFIIKDTRIRTITRKRF